MHPWCTAFFACCDFSLFCCCSCVSIAFADSVHVSSKTPFFIMYLSAARWNQATSVGDEQRACFDIVVVLYISQSECLSLEWSTCLISRSLFVELNFLVFPCFLFLFHLFLHDCALLPTLLVKTFIFCNDFCVTLFQISTQPACNCYRKMLANLSHFPSMATLHCSRWKEKGTTWRPFPIAH